MLSLETARGWHSNISCTLIFVVGQSESQKKFVVGQRTTVVRNCMPQMILLEHQCEHKITKYGHKSSAILRESQESRLIFWVRPLWLRTDISATTNTHKQSVVTIEVFVLWLHNKHYYTCDVIGIKMTYSYYKGIRAKTRHEHKLHENKHKNHANSLHTFR